MTENENEVKKKSEKIKTDIRESHNFLVKAKQEIVKQNDYLEFVGERVDKSIWDANYIENAISTYEQYPEIIHDPIYQEQIEFLQAELSGIREFSSAIYDKSKEISFNYTELSGIVSQSDMNMGTGVIGIHSYYSTLRAHHPSVPINLISPQENPHRKTNSLIEELGKIDDILPQRIEEITRSITVISKIKHLKNIAHDMREFISEFLQLCATQDQVTKMAWVKFSKKNVPTQESRALFTIVGNNPQFSSGTFVDQSIKNIAVKYRELYKNLNGFAHYRGRRIKPEHRMKLDIYYNQLLEFTKIIIDLRSLHFLD
jgi:hypothetical protein